MSDSPALDALVSVTPRFARSVALARDAGRGDALDGYLLTPTGRDVLRRLAAALRGESSTRAWSVTGPYGSGKSSLALLAAQLLAGDDRVRRHARDFLADADATLAAAFPAAGGRLLPVLVTGSRRPLDKALAAALAAALRGVAVRGRPPQVIDQLERLANQAAPAGTAVVGLFEEANAYLARPGGECAGLLLVVDELGKFLEFGAANPEQGDVFVLQELAEAATRSARPFLVLTVLHQALDRYAEHLSPGRRAEWAKVQGRFEDVAFEERGEQLLRLLAHAVRRQGTDADLTPLRERAGEFAAEAVAVGVRAGVMPAGEVQDCLAACYPLHPLHPLTAVVLGPLFRQLAQNERSLFAFLASSEPFGFREFLHAQTAAGGAYRLDALYDYVVTALGPALFATHRGRLWSEVQTAPDRLHDASEVEVRLAKTVGLLQALGPAAGVPASAAVLKFALRGVTPDAGVDEALQSIARRSVVVFRRHAGSYALWEGSDVEIEARLLAARQAVEPDSDLAGFLTRQVPAQARVARRHYFQTGTLRYYDAVYCDLADLGGDLFATVLGGAGGADGRVLYCLPRDAGNREAMRALLGSAVAETPVVAALPHDVADLRERCHELVCLRWVADNTPELESDRTARRELNARLAVAERDLRAHLDALFSPSNPGCSWFCRGGAVPVANARQLNDLLSQACDEVYAATPRWRNELVNRRSLSSSAAGARRNLIEAAFERPDADGLGLEGHPPERAMYETLLKGTRRHRKHGGVLGFHAPDAKAEPAVRAIWAAIEAFLDGTDAGRRPVERLFATLRRPPFGLKDGVLPVLLAAALAHAPARVALYEDGSFVPKPNAAVFERLFRAPGKFELQRFTLAGPRSEAFRRYAAMIQRTPGGGDDLLTVVKPMLRLAKDLPEYVTKTKSIGDDARRVLKAVREARQPDKLLFADLPAACECPPIGSSGRADADALDAFFARLRAAFAELQGAYPKLLADVARLTLAAFGESGPLPTARPAIARHARLVLGVAVDAKLKALLLRAADDGVGDDTWLESIATLLAGKPPVHWDDPDRAKFELQVGARASTFLNCTPLHRRTWAARVLRSRSIFRVNGAVLDVEGFALSQFEQLTTWFRGDQRAPHKPLLVLLALGEWSRGNSSVKFSETAKPLAELLQRFGPPRKTYHPEYPFWRLQRDGIWDVRGVTTVVVGKDGGATIGSLIAADAVGSFSDDVRAALTAEPALVAELARMLLKTHFPDSLHDDILDAVGLELDDPRATGGGRDPNFRKRVLTAYQHQCAICGLQLLLSGTSVALEAARIRWHQAHGPATVPNGQCLCVLHHKLLDLGALTFSSDLTVLISDELSGLAGLNEHLLVHHGKPIRPPLRHEDAPDLKYVEWHRREVFRGSATGGANLVKVQAMAGVTCHFSRVSGVSPTKLFCSWPL